MMVFLQTVLVFWVIGTVLIFLIGLVTYADAKGPQKKREGARMMFAAGLWPAAAAILIARNFRRAWRDADWKEFKR